MVDQNPEPIPSSHALVLNSEYSQKRRRAFADLLRSIPTNDLGMPKFIYRTDMIPPDIYSIDQERREQILTASMVPVSYVEGFPALEDGQPLWSQMPFEPSDSYSAFCSYLEDGQKNGVRLVENISMELGKQMPLLMEYFHLYYWKIRAKAFDLYITTVHEKRRIQRLMQCDDNHYIVADGLINKCKEYFSKIDWESIDPAVVARMLPQMMEVQRKAAGGTSNGVNGGEPTNVSIEVMLRQMTRLEHAHSDGANANATPAIQDLLENPEAAEIAQDLIIKLGTSPKQKEPVGEY